MYNKERMTTGRQQKLMQPIIELKNVSFRYGEDDPWIVNSCSFAIYHGESVAIIGLNGFGTSAVAKSMKDLFFPEEGEIWLRRRELYHEILRDKRKDVY